MQAIEFTIHSYCMVFVDKSNSWYFHQNGENILLITRRVKINVLLVSMTGVKEIIN